MWWRLMKCQQMRMQAPYDVAAAINAAVNASTTYRTDAQSFGVPEFWETAGQFGDCEDYALAKRARLLAAGWPPDLLGLCVCVDETGAGHCVLYVYTIDRGAWILDNRHEWPMRPHELPYTWSKMLCDGKWRQLLGWSS